MPRALWSGAISFGLVNIPVKMVTATRGKDIAFHMLHAKDGARIRYVKTCPKDGEEVTMEDVVRGFEVAKGQYVTFTDEELESLDPKASRTIDIQDFTEAAGIDPSYYDKPYYLVPDRGADKAYALLMGALETSGKVAIARVVMREKEHLVAIRARDGVLVMETMRWAEEVVPPESVASEVKAAVKDIDKREMAMAKQLVDALTAEFDPAKYRNEHRERVLGYIEQKAAGHEVVREPAAPAAARTSNLMDALQASLKAAQEEIATGRTAKTRPARKARAKAKAAKPHARGHARAHTGGHSSEESVPAGAED